MLKLCPTCLSSADRQAMFCGRCGVSIAHVEPIEPGVAVPRRSRAATPAPLRQQSTAIAARDETRDETLEEREEVSGDATERVGLATTIGAVAGAMAGAVLRGALEGVLGGGDCAYRGAGPFGEVLLSADGTQVYSGINRFGPPIYLIDGTELREPGFLGRVLARLDDDKVRLGAGPWGDVIATIEGPRVYRGRSTWGQPIAYVQSGRAMLSAAAAYHLLRG